MIVICEDCGKKYRVDTEKVADFPASFNCLQCENSITVEDPNQTVFDNLSQITEAGSLDREATSFDSEQLNRSEPFSEPDSADPSITASETHTMTSPKSTSAGMSIVTKVVLIMLLVSLVPMLIYWASSFKVNMDRLRKNTETLSSQVTDGLVGQVDEWIDKNIRVLKAVAKLEAITSMDPMLQEPVLKAIGQEYPWMYLVFSTDSTGMNISRSDGKSLRDYSDRSYYKDVMAGKELAWQTLIGKTSKKPAMVLAIPIIRNDNTVGVLATAMTTEAISQRVATWKRGNTGKAFLVDETGKVVAHQDEKYVIEQKNLSSHGLISYFKQGNDGTHYFSNETGEAYIGNVRKTKYGWAMAIEQSEQEAFEELRREQLYAVVFISVIVVIVVLLAVFAGRAIANPIKKLTDIADRISVGELDLEFNIKSKDEIAALGDAISRMQDSIRLSIERARRRR